MLDAKHWGNLLQKKLKWKWKFWNLYYVCFKLLTSNNKIVVFLKKKKKGWNLVNLKKKVFVVLFHQNYSQQLTFDR